MVYIILFLVIVSTLHFIKMKQVTYYVGAGASYNSIPLATELGERMIAVAKRLATPDLTIDTDERIFAFSGDTSKGLDTLLQNIGYFGQQAIEFGSLDNYAKYLHDNKENVRYTWLKLSLNAFLTAWQQSIDSELKVRESNVLSNIDNRYHSLMGNVTQPGTNGITLKPNVSFISWNYDTQLERTFQKYSRNKDWDDLAGRLFFRPGYAVGNRLQICHLNGFHGFYQTKEGKEIRFIDRTEDTSMLSIFKSFEHIIESQMRGQLDQTRYIKFAWEDNNEVGEVKRDAASILQETDYLVIIGYSFPDYNGNIDRELLAQLKEDCIIYYIDSNPAKYRLQSRLPLKNYENVVYMSSRSDIQSFYLPL